MGSNRARALLRAAAQGDDSKREPRSERAPGVPMTVQNPRNHLAGRL